MLSLALIRLPAADGHGAGGAGRGGGLRTRGDAGQAEVGDGERAGSRRGQRMPPRAEAQRAARRAHPDRQREVPAQLAERAADRRQVGPPVHGQRRALAARQGEPGLLVRRDRAQAGQGGHRQLRQPDRKRGQLARRGDHGGLAHAREGHVDPVGRQRGREPHQAARSDARLPGAVRAGDLDGLRGGRQAAGRPHDQRPDAALAMPAQVDDRTDALGGPRHAARSADQAGREPGRLRGRVPGHADLQQARARRADLAEQRVQPGAGQGERGQPAVAGSPGWRR